jgi:hypothetical protein
MKNIHRSEWLAYIKWRIMKWWRNRHLSIGRIG